RTDYYFGDDAEDLARHGNVADGTARQRFPAWTWAIRAEDGHVFTAPVGQFPANPWGLHDMHDQVWGWCQDGYDARFYSAGDSHPVPGDPVNRDGAGGRVPRGGSWNCPPGRCRAALRPAADASHRDATTGFRVCLRPD